MHSALLLPSKFVYKRYLGIRPDTRKVLGRLFKMSSILTHCFEGFYYISNQFCPIHNLKSRSVTANSCKKSEIKYVSGSKLERYCDSLSGDLNLTLTSKRFLKMTQVYSMGQRTSFYVNYFCRKIIIHAANIW